MLKVEMLCTGDEVLHGQIVDTNAAWLADYLFQQGLPMSGRATVGDDLNSLIDALKKRSLDADVLIVNGGLGPTSDDLSALAAAKALGEELIERPEWIATMEAYFVARGRTMSASNRKQAMIPSSAKLIDNPVGTACGFSIELNQCLIFFTPGVPSELKVMVEQQIVPQLRERFELGEPPICLRLTTFGRTESALAGLIEPLSFPDGASMGYRSSMPIIELKLTGPGSLRDEMEKAWQQVRDIAGENCIFEGTAGLPMLIKQQLQSKKLALALSEQFTAGLLNWQLHSVQTPLVAGELMPESGAGNLASIAARARILASHSGADVALAVGGLIDDKVSVALHVSDKTYGMQVRYQARHHSQRIRQEVTAMLALDMLRRWLKDWSVYGHYEWLTIDETL